MLSYERTRLIFESMERRELLSVTTKLVGDFNTGKPSAELQTDNAWLNGELFFAADDGNGDVELWKSDGTAEGTVRVKDIRPGPNGSLPRDFIAIEGKVLFTAYSDEFGRELWSTDGTEAGTTIIQDIEPGPQSVQSHSFASMGDELYFVSHNPVSDDILWTTDGSSAGTKRIKSFPSIRRNSLAHNGSVLLFTAHAGDVRGLWASDGTTDGTTLLTPDYVEGVGSPVVSGEYTFFNAVYDSRDWLWKSDGTVEGTIEVQNLGSDQDRGPRKMVANDDGVFFLRANRLYSSDGTPEGTSILRSFGELQSVGAMMPIGANLFFTVEDLAPFQGFSSELWRTDGTRAGTSRVRSLGNGFSQSILSIEDRLFLTVDVTSNESGDLWTSDGTRAGTTPLTSVADPRHVRVIGGQLYFVKDDPERGHELWRTDGTDEGTVALEIAPGAAGSNPWIMAADESKILIWSTNEESYGLWNLPVADTQPELINNAIVGPSASTTISNLVEVAGKAFFLVGGKLWQTDGTNTVPIEMDDPIGDLVAVGNQLYFTVVDDAGEIVEIWRTDGTTLGTMFVAGVDDDVFDPNSLTGAGGQLYFWAEDGDQQQKLWTLRNSDREPVVVKELPWSFGYPSMAEANGELFFTFQAGEDTDAELWKVDPSIGQPERILALPGNARLRGADHQVYISVFNENDDMDDQLWRSDGTASGTYFLADVGIHGYHDRLRVAIAGNRLFFFDRRSDELVTSDGTVEGTRFVKQVQAVTPFPGAGPGNIVAVGETIFFNGRDSADVEGLWTSDGTEAGTMMLTSNDADVIGRGANVVYFRTSDAPIGNELWQSDGTIEGTKLVTDLNPGPADSKYGGNYGPENSAAEINGRLYFTGDDGFHGSELWQMTTDSETRSTPGDANRDGVFNSSDLVQAFQRGEYEDQISGNSSWEDGDWNGDGDFTTADLVFAFQSGGYQAAASLHASELDDVSLFDWTDDSDRKKRLTLDPDTGDDSLQQGTLT